MTTPHTGESRSGSVLGERPELARVEYPMAGVDVLVSVMVQLHPERVVDRVPAHVVGMPEVVHIELPMHLLDAGHESPHPVLVVFYVLECR